MSTPKLPEEFYVGFAKNRETASGKPLAFATPNGTDAAAKKRKSSVDNWVAGNWRKDPNLPNIGKIYKNTPRRGFKLVDWSDRYCTDNKVARVLDPHGYELEIYIPNLMNLILSTTITNGEIDAELIWIRDGANNRLVRTDDPILKEIEKASKAAKPKKLRHEPGDIIVCQDVHYLYLGLMDVDYFIKGGEKVVDKQMTNQRNYRGGGHSLFGGGLFGPSAHNIELYYTMDGDYEATSVGRKHVYLQADGWAYSRNREDINNITISKREGIVLRKGQMTTYEIVSSGNELPTFDENTYWRTDETLYYDHEGNVGSFDKMYSNYRDFYRSLDVEIWQTEVLRFQDGKMTAPVDQKKVKKVEKRY